MMRWITVIAAFLGIVFLWSCGGGNGGSPPGIYGKVVSKGTGQPIANATVVLFRDGNEVALVETPESGSFSFPNLEAGSYTLVIDAEGYLQAQVRVTLEQGSRLTVTVDMIPEREGPPTDVPITD